MNFEISIRHKFADHSDEIRWEILLGELEREPVVPDGVESFFDIK